MHTHFVAAAHFVLQNRVHNTTTHPVNPKGDPFVKYVFVCMPSWCTYLSCVCARAARTCLHTHLLIEMFSYSVIIIESWLVHVHRYVLRFIHRLGIVSFSISSIGAYFVSGQRSGHLTMDLVMKREHSGFSNTLWVKFLRGFINNFYTAVAVLLSCLVLRTGTHIGVRVKPYDCQVFWLYANAKKYPPWN